MAKVSESKSHNLSEKEQKKCENPVNERVEETKDQRIQLLANKNYLTISIYALFVIVIGAFIIYMFVNMKQTKTVISNFINNISPFIVALFIAFLINPMIKRLDNFLHHVVKLKSKGLRIFISMLTSYLLVIGGLTITILYVTPQLIQSISDLVSKQSLMRDEVYNFFSGIYEKYPDLNLESVVQYVENMIPDLFIQGTQLLSSMIPKLYLFSVSLIKMFVNILLSIVISCYLILDKKNLKFNAKRIIFSVMSEEKARGFIQTGKECANIFNKFIVGKFIDSLIIGILCFIIMSILRLPYSILISVIVGITNMIPYFGPFIGAIPGIVIYIFINPIQCLIFTVMIFLLQQFDGLYLGPKILGESTGLKPLWIILAITLGGAYAGVVGMFLAVPVVAVITYLMDKVIKKRLDSKNIVLEKSPD
ncbi:AI-2E family transporter [Anaerocolumna aminovalerica]|uniref:Predicted PurR-regulated permease PerM n=1 Tax=Anaerocolumna aminovalerica TaxID=1527 RepID=A0A1I5GTR7_9FIRM|nr:AI-2E family transporter [Anaerocolumna aminovalerica]MDU6264126.1 AI-2E family transporter [Anaerocolumna aminovalerica]SFO39412.1 Predicted PurR-regulated permease PerM [Anaerocolumna aminovalerica]